jgi:hypothetical protein
MRYPGSSGHYGEEKNLLSPPGIKPRLFSRSDHSLVTVLTELPRLFHLERNWAHICRSQNYFEQEKKGLHTSRLLQFLLM